MIKEEFKNLTPEQIPAQIALYQEDERKGVQNFLLSQVYDCKLVIYSRYLLSHYPLCLLIPFIDTSNISLVNSSFQGISTLILSPYI